MVYKLLSGSRRAAALISIGVFAVLSLGLGWYVGYQASLRIMDVQSGRVNFSVPAFLALDHGSLDPDVVSLRADTVRLQVSAVEPSAQALFIASSVLTSAAVLFAVATVVLLCYRLIRGTPFGGGSTWLVALSGITAVATGLIGPVLEGSAKQIAIAHLQGISSLESPIRLGDVVFYVSSSFELMPLFVGLSAFLLAAVFRRGDVLDRDAKGLV
ncbi:hypothetical protein [Pseudarthrobacter sp. Y6]|uniref:hypothetical protein n=1 Tax=Pseudarthrobacter sp. Y6 TaxID=3418422 RepID=UPI003CED9114